MLAVPTDVSDEGAVQALAEAAVERFGAVHIACNNAGVATNADPWSARTFTGPGPPSACRSGVSILRPGWVATGIHDSGRNWPDRFGDRPLAAPAR